MNASTDAPPAAARLVGSWSAAVVDADVHAVVPTLSALEPYLAPQWRSFVQETGLALPVPPRAMYPPNTSVAVRDAWRPSDARVAASDLTQLREHVLDVSNTTCAIVNCWWGGESIRHPDLGAALASAVNDWLIAEWLEPEPRLRASIVIPGHLPDAAADEIDRVGGHPGFVQVLLPVRSSRLYGNRIWHPMFEAICRNDLVAGIHYGGQPDGPPTPTGWPSWYLEEYVAIVPAYLAQLTSLIGEGVFEKFPTLRAAMLEGGFAWLPGAMWRLDKEWKGLRRDIPWVKQLPSRTIREHIRFAVQPLDVDSEDALSAIVSWLGTDDLLMFSSDYPHGHGQSVDLLLDAMPVHVQQKLMVDNARALYKL